MKPNPNPTLYGPNGQIVKSNVSKSVRKVSGGHVGSLSNWHADRVSKDSEPYQRETVTTRAQDLYANDPNAANLIDTMSASIAGTGLIPQSMPNQKLLGWTDEQTNIFKTQAEWAFKLWSKEADAAGRLPFWAIQYTSVQSMLTNGEFFRIPVMINDDPTRTFSLALQSVSPLRCTTPTDLTSDSSIRDGVKMGKYGKPESYFFTNPDENMGSYGLDSSEYVEVPANVGHRAACFHVFLNKEEEQVRGVSVLSPGMKAFRDLADYFDYELLAAILSASFPVFMETDSAGESSERDLDGESLDHEPIEERYQNVSPGTILYGNSKEKPHILANPRPGNTFAEFVESVLRRIGCGAGMPYEVISKDFSKTNYSSARAALMEAWRLYGIYQKWLIDCFCQKVWEMVLEEAWLRGMILLPKGSPDWYVARHAYCQALWIPPRKGSMDPLKDSRSNDLNLKNNTETLSEILMDKGMDLDTHISTRKMENDKLKAAGLVPEVTNA